MRTSVPRGLLVEVSSAGRTVISAGLVRLAARRLSVDGAYDVRCRWSCARTRLADPACNAPGWVRVMNSSSSRLDTPSLSKTRNR